MVVSQGRVCVKERVVAYHDAATIPPAEHAKAVAYSECVKED